MAHAGPLLVCAATPQASLTLSSARPLGFYLFTLPAWQLIAGWLLTLAVLVCVLAVLFLIAAGGGRALGGRFGGPASLPLARHFNRRRIPALYAGHS